MAQNIETLVIPVIAEELVVDKRRVERARTRVAKTVERTTATVDEVLDKETWEVERVQVERVVASAEPPRQEGDTLVVPVYEERLVVEKRLVLVEEVRLTRKRQQVRDPREVELRRERVIVQREE